MFERTKLLLPLAALLLASANSYAQDSGPAIQLAQMGGAMHAAAEVCGDYSQDQLQEMKKQQKSSIQSMGLNDEDFDKAFEQGLDRGRQDLQKATAEQRQQMCEQLRSGPKF
ncbi:hypothetical protein [Alcaligenes faecalis]|mgnify:FL=1|jgi:hypothetical protein|uniref:Uncharacterized protein n=1 Tax=Alcaligenes faecalis TaxID=511 RepID=A0ABY7N5C9_ALCFA|nr:hypothetical protein [Alcaligenes faecalis]QHS35620.1 hypothetical protein GWQ43_05795 [Alcaligenes faecalis]WBM39315.1 hypothetical protein M2J83_05695 [Alcaligenes faecalis]